MSWKKLALEQAILIERQREEIAMLKAKIAQLEKNSSNSSKTKKVSNYGKRFLDAIGDMFKTLHRKDDLQYVNWFRRMKEHQRVILKVAWHRLPSKDKDAWNIAVRLWNEESSYFRFIAEGLPATNNLCEQSMNIESPCAVWCRRYS